jgi:hypothetical protein
VIKSQVCRLDNRLESLGGFGGRDNNVDIQGLALRRGSVLYSRIG